MDGFFGLRTAVDLREKLRRTLEVIRRDRLNVDAAFDFFVTAEHMPEWVFGADAKRANELRRSHGILRVCSHLANGAKHFEVKDKRHQSVEGVADISFWPPGFWPPGFWPDGLWPGELVVTLAEGEGVDVPRTVSVPLLAERIMAFWDDPPLHVVPHLPPKRLR